MNDDSDTPAASGSLLTGLDGRRCGSCGSLGYPGDKYCACCGAQMMKLCRTCSAPVEQPVANFCTQCGSPIANADRRR